jgi:methionine synthase II (cobalamin-independent)
MKTKQNELQQAREDLIKGKIKYKEFREIELKYIKKLLKGAKQ